MKLIKITLLSALLCITLTLTGCALFTKNNANTNNSEQNTNQTVNANVNTLNVNAVSNDNTNTKIDISDWKTYTNEEYGFSFKYPEEWGDTQVVTNNTAPFLIIIGFKNLVNPHQDILGNPRLVVSDNGSYTVSASDSNSWFDYSKVNFSKTDDQLAQDLNRNLTEKMTAEKMIIGTRPILKVFEKTLDFDGSVINTFHILIPNYNSKQNNLTISGDALISEKLLQVANTLIF